MGVNVNRSRGVELYGYKQFTWCDFMSSRLMILCDTSVIRLVFLPVSCRALSSWLPPSLRRCSLSCLPVSVKKQSWHVQRWSAT